MNKKLFAKLFAIVLAACVIFSLAVIVTSAADGDPVATFTLGANGSATHADGSSKTTYSEENNGYTLNITGGTNMYTGARDAKGNSCIKFGASSKAGSMTISVPDDVTTVILYVAKYKANTTKITVNGTSYTLTSASNNGEYDAITVDTTTTNTITFTTVSGGYRAMLNTVEFYAATDPDAPVCEHENTTIDTVEATCTVDGSITETCDDCEKVISTEKIPAPGHTGGTATCTELAECDECGETYGKLDSHEYEDGVCVVCGEVEPNEATITFDADKTNRTEYDTSHQVWEENGIIFTNTKASSTNNVADYGGPVRCYKGSSITIEGNGNITKIVFNCTSSYVVNSSITTSTENVASVDVDGTTVTVTLAEPTNAFTFALAAQTRFNSITVYYDAAGSDAPDAPACEHANVSTATTDATCHVDGSIVVTCDDCGEVQSRETVPAAHTFANGVCSVCNLVEAPKAGVPYKFGMYQGNKGATYYINGEKDDKGTYYYLATSADVASGVNVYLEETEGGYYMYTYIAGVKTYINMYLNGTYVNNELSETASTVYTYDTTAMQLVANVNDAEYAFGTRNDNTYTTVGPVKVSYNGFHCQFYAAGDVAKFNSASVTLGTDLGMIFKATVPAGVPTLTVEFNGKTYELTGNAVDTVYSFNFKGIGPHQMALNIKATLKVDGVAVAEINNYSVEKNLNSIKNAEGASAALVELVNSVLIYGSESEKYVGIEEGVNADELANDVAENNATYTLDNAETFGFTAAGVNFDAMNRIYVKFFVEGDFTLTVNGAVVAVEKTEDGYYKVYTDALEATQFADEYTFVITSGDETATLTYSVNAYAAAMKDDAEMGALAEALYAYGVKAKAYAG